MMKKLMYKKNYLLFLGIILILVSVFILGRRIYYKNLISDCFNKNKEIDIYKCVQDVAIERGSLGICNLIKDTKEVYPYNSWGEPHTLYVKKEDCLLELAEKKLDESICNKINDGKTKSRCLDRIATKKNDLSICEKIRDSEKRELCMQGIASKLNDLSVCEKLTYRYIKDICFEDIAPDLKDDELCAKINDPFGRDSCYCEISQDSEDLGLKIELVEKIKQKTKSNHLCILPVVEINKNYELCKMISDEKFKKECLNIK